MDMYFFSTPETNMKINRVLYNEMCEKKQYLKGIVCNIREGLVREMY